MVVAGLSVTACVGPDAGDAATLELSHWTWSAPGYESRSIELPAHPGDWMAARRAEYHIETRVTLPDEFRGQNISLAVNRLAAGARAFTDGAELALIQDPPLGSRSRQGYAWLVPASATTGGELRLTISVRHDWTQSGWLDTTPRLIAAPHADHSYWFTRRFNYIVAFSAFALSFLMAGSNFLVWLFRRRHRATLWLSGQSVAGCVYPLFVTGQGEWLWGPYEPLAIANALVVSCVTSIYFSAVQFDLARPSRAWWLFPLVVGAGSFVFASPFESTRFAIWSVAITLATVCVYHLRYFWISQRQRHPLRRSIAVTSLA